MSKVVLLISKMASLIRQSRLWDMFLSGSVIFYVLSGLTSLLNYLFYPAVARLLSISDYGEVQFLVSMFGQLAVGFVVLNILTVIVSVQLTGTRQIQAIRILSSLSTYIATLFAVIGTVALLWFHRQLGIHSSSAVIMLGISLVANVPFVILIGKLQGAGKFVGSGIVGLISVAIKLIISVLFAAIGLKTAGVIAGITVGLIASLVTGWFIDRSFLIIIGSKPSHVLASLASLSFIRRHAIVAIIAIATLTLLSSIDLVVSRLVLTPEAAGRYAAIATVAKILLALSTPLMWLALPAALKQNGWQLRRYLSMTAGVCGTATLLFVLFPALFTQVLLGINPGPYLHLLPVASLSMLAFAMAFLTITTCICINKLRLVLLSALGALVIYISCTILFILFFSPLEASLYAQLIAGVSIVTFTLPVILTLPSHRSPTPPPKSDTIKIR